MTQLSVKAHAYIDTCVLLGEIHRNCQQALQHRRSEQQSAFIVTYDARPSDKHLVFFEEIIAIQKRILSEQLSELGIQAGLFTHKESQHKR